MNAWGIQLTIVTFFFFSLSRLSSLSHLLSIWKIADRSSISIQWTILFFSLASVLLLFTDVDCSLSLNISGFRDSATLAFYPRESHSFTLKLTDLILRAVLRMSHGSCYWTLGFPEYSTMWNIKLVKVTAWWRLLQS